MLNQHSLMHPRTLWEIEAAMWRAAVDSKNGGHSMHFAYRADGEMSVCVSHCRFAFPRFLFRDKRFNDITPIVLKAIRASTKGE